MTIPSDLIVFEIDVPERLQARMERLASSETKVNFSRTLVPADLAGDWITPLCATNFTKEKPTLWIIEGVLPYLNDEATCRLLETLRGYSAHGSQMWCDHIHSDILVTLEQDSVLDRRRELLVPWCSTWSDPVNQLARSGWAGRAWTLNNLITPLPENPPASWMPTISSSDATLDTQYRWFISAKVQSKSQKDLLMGLCEIPKRVQIKYIYDCLGSQIFEQVTKAPGYYLTKTECAIIDRHADDIAACVAARTLIELGSGSSEKAKKLLDIFHVGGDLTHYIAVDISADALEKSKCALRAQYKNLVIKSMAGDFTDPIPFDIEARPALVTMLGSTIENQLPQERHHLFCNIHSQMQRGDALLLGLDLVKDEEAMISAYGDGKGSLAAFFKNGLTVLNYELGANFDLDNFNHITTWNRQCRRVENLLQAKVPHVVTLSNPNSAVHFKEKEELQVGISYKFCKEEVRTELLNAGFSLSCWWEEPKGRYALVRSHCIIHEER
ncbi:hypothetical protein K7432_015506 [Basidiobolus ranarum]|uniref:Histidine-specific methyltransferase SAM-dependent domain-containing protein n=1 Tax=Basidiobolus ranarum TaxID=34480 RepID=A0ABR2VMZ2_9FUNG